MFEFKMDFSLTLSKRCQTNNWKLFLTSKFAGIFSCWSGNILKIQIRNPKSVFSLKPRMENGYRKLSSLLSLYPKRSSFHRLLNSSFVFPKGRKSQGVTFFDTHSDKKECIYLSLKKYILFRLIFFSVGWRWGPTLEISFFCSPILCVMRFELPCRLEDKYIGKIVTVFP